MTLWYDLYSDGTLGIYTLPILKLYITLASPPIWSSWAWVPNKYLKSVIPNDSKYLTILFPSIVLPASIKAYSPLEQIRAQSASPTSKNVFLNHYLLL